MWDLGTIVARNNAASVIPGKTVALANDFHGPRGTVVEVDNNNALVEWDYGSKSQHGRRVLVVIED
jgi:hypothetical protein